MLRVMRSIGMTLIVALVALPACGGKKDDGTSSAKTSDNGGKKPDTKPDPKSGTGTGTGTGTDTGTKTDTPPPPVDDPVAAAGVEAGGIERDKDEGPAASLSAVDGTVEVRRVGEADFAAAKKDDDLFPGDVVRTGDKSSAQITMADESVIELAEITTVGIASRDASADPASGAAVLAGIARFTVSDRAPGEAAFKVYTPSGVVMTKGTVYAVGVAATGEARVGVESGAVEVVGLGALDADPVAVEASHAASMSADGTVAGSVDWTTDDWGQWRDDSEANIDAGAVVEANGAALTSLAADLNAAYADLDASAQAFADFETKAAAAADAKATADYEAVAPEGAADIEASFDLAGAIQAMTWSYEGHAELASDAYARHPDEVKTQWTVVAPHIDAAVLWPKRFEVTADAYLEPLRVQYYVHHPRGRVHAELVGVAVPEFYQQVDVPEPDPATVRARVRTHVWLEPDVIVHANARPVWIAAPAPHWRAKVKVHVAPPRAKVAWYVRPATLHATVIYGVEVKQQVKPTIVIKEREPRAKLRAHWHGDANVGMRVKVAPPDLKAAADARVKVKLDAGRIVVRDHRTGKADVDVVVKDHRDDAANAGADVKGKVDVTVKDHRNDAANVGGDVKGDVKVKVNDHRDDAGNAAGDVKVKVKDHREDVKGKADAGAKVKVKVKAPDVKVKVKAGGSIKIGH
jgi:hypothetical protein